MKENIYRCDPSTVVSIGPERAAGFCGGSTFMETPIVFKGDSITENLLSLSEAPDNVKQLIVTAMSSLGQKSPLL